jgi:hypothetical protein
VLNHTNYILGAGEDTRVTLGAFLEIFVMIGNVGTAVVMFPSLRRYSETLSLSYVAWRTIESTIIGIGAISLLSIVTLRDDLAASAAEQLAALGKMVAGPNLITGMDPSGLNLLRLGIWVQDAGFPILLPQPPTFPLPRLNDQGAQAGFALADRLPVPVTLGLSFAMSVPTTTLQSLVDAVFPQVKDAADGTFVTLDAIRAGTNPPDTVSMALRRTRCRTFQSARS